MLTIDQLTDDFMTAHLMREQLMKLLETRNVVNIPCDPEDDPSLKPMSLHSLFVDPEGNIMFVEPGNGYAVIKEHRYLVLCLCRRRRQNSEQAAAAANELSAYCLTLA